ncbi:MAG TPA: TonB-dependent receptor [Microscillaceae bacterium]|nr:TonB-dependent receptor [Microscillaceae bacterium]
MKKNFTQFILIFLLMAMYQAQAQSGVEVRGTVQEKGKTETLPGATVILAKPKATTGRGEVTNNQGAFVFKNVKPGNYVLRISFIGYKTFAQNITVGSQPLNVGTLSLQVDSKRLKEIKVTGKVPPVEIKGDSAQFNALAYKTNPDATAQDLVRKLPGVSVENGQVKVGGENVQQVLVDGKPFFGNDPRAAMQNLPAEVISKIQVFDQQSEQSRFTGFDDGNTTKTINFVTKVNMRKGSFGRVYAGGGQDKTQNGRYEVGANYNLFRDDTRITLIGQSNNINQQNFASEDLVGVASAGGGRRGRRRGRRGGGVNDFLVNQQDGIVQTHALGANYVDNLLNKKLDISANYFFNRGDNLAQQLTNEEYLLGRTEGQLYDENSTSNSINMNHRLNARIRYRFSRRTSLVWSPRFSFQQNNGSSLDFGQTTQNGVEFNSFNNDFRSDLTGLQLTNFLLLRHRFAARGRTISVRVRNTYNQNQGESFLDSDITENGIDDASLNQFSDILTNSQNIQVNATYTEPVSFRSMMMFTYGIQNQFGNSDTRTFDFSEVEQEYNQLNNTLSNTNDNNYFAHQATLGFMTRPKRQRIMIRLTYQNAELTSRQTLPGNFEIRRNFVNVLPMAMYSYRFSKSKNLRVFYRTNTTAPTVEQLQNVIDNSNPIQLEVGNPNLEQSVNHRLFARYRSTNVETSSIFFGLISVEHTQNYIGQSTQVFSQDTVVANYAVAAGSQLTQTVNLDGFYRVRTFLTYGFPLNFAKSNLNLSPNALYTRTPGLVNQIENISDNFTTGFNATLSSNISENVDFTVSSRSSYNWVINSQNSAANNEFFNQNTNIILNLIFWKGMVFRSDVSHQYFNGLADGFNQDFWLWSLSIGKKFLRKKQAEIRITVFDVLGQNNSLQRTVTDASIQSIQTNVLQQYVMATFSYKFKNFAGKVPVRKRKRRRFF